MDEARWERIDRTIEYLTNQQASSDARFSLWIDKSDCIIDSLEQASHRHDDLIATVFAMQEGTQRNLDRAVKELTEKQKELTENQKELTDSQRHTDEKLNALIGFVDRNHR